MIGLDAIGYHISDVDATVIIGMSQAYVIASTEDEINICFKFTSSSRVTTGHI